MDSLAVLVVLALLIAFIWFGCHFRFRILDAFSSVQSEYGTIVEKEYTPPHSQMITRTIVRDHGDSGFTPTRYDIPDEIQIAEEYLLHINLNGRFIITPVTDKLYNSVNQGDRVFVRYSQGRFSKKIYLKAIKRSQSSY